MWLVTRTEGAGVRGCLVFRPRGSLELLAAGPCLLNAGRRASQAARAGQVRAQQRPDSPPSSLTMLGLASRCCCIGCCHTWMNPTNLTYGSIAWNARCAPIPTECPLPHLEMLWRGKKSLRLATTGTLGSQLLPKTSRAHLPTLHTSPRVPLPQLVFLTPLFFLHQVRRYSGDSSRPSSLSLFPLPLLTTNLVHHSDPVRNNLQTWRPKRRRSVSYLSLLSCPTPRPQSLSSSCGSPTPCNSELGCTGALP